MCGRILDTLKIEWFTQDSYQAAHTQGPGGAPIRIIRSHVSVGRPPTRSPRPSAIKNIKHKALLVVRLLVVPLPGGRLGDFRASLYKSSDCPFFGVLTRDKATEYGDSMAERGKRVTRFTFFFLALTLVCAYLFQHQRKLIQSTMADFRILEEFSVSYESGHHVVDDDAMDELADGTANTASTTTQADAPGSSYEEDGVKGTGTRWIPNTKAISPKEGKPSFVIHVGPSKVRRQENGRIHYSFYGMASIILLTALRLPPDGFYYDAS
jgi:hypothetical protein